MTASRSIILLTGVMLGTLSVCAQVADKEAAEKPQVVHATYEHAQISHIMVEVETGMVFFDAGEEHFLWYLHDGTWGEKLQAAFLMADRLSQAVKIETRRVVFSKREEPVAKGAGPRVGTGLWEREHDGHIHHRIIDLILHQAPPVK